MRKTFVLLGISLLVVGLAAVSSARDGSAAFHLMRVYGVLGGANGNANIQYVELRLTDAGQNFVGTHHICFYDGTGAAYARFRFAASPPNGADEASILVGTSEFDAAWPAGTLGADYTFSASNTVAIQGGADVLHPVRTPAGKVAFGTDTQTTPSLMCQGGFTPVNVIDSVAYGTGYSGGVEFGTRLNADLTTSGTNAVRLQGPICFQAGSGTGTPCANPRNNSVDYAITNVNTAGNNPRNNASQSGPISPPDADGDGVGDGADLCPGTAPAAPVDANGCSQAQVDADGDGFCDPGAPSGGPGPCTGTDNCPRWANPAQNLPPWSVPLNDPDCDGFTTAAENALGVDPNDPCADTPAAGDEGPPDDKWPVDFNDNGFVNTLDLTVYAGALGKLSTDPGYVARADLNSNNVINTLDLTPYATMLSKFCNS